ncbi:MAG: hypothetical protein KKB03_01160 [Nanoarchaeota archaeon]|nr:hypothetical protein [Nanoarchaeota archaeon]MBU1135864.1 hypothetical protein [Nanoarchaeota archaeon]MBU2519836.1 hypothetical protein [Nanoarchaeota archaeon]
MIDYGELSLITANSALEIDNYILGRNKSFEYTEKLLETFEEKLLKNPTFSWTFYNAIKKGTDKEFEKVSDLAPEMSLLKLELDDIIKLRGKEDRAEDLRSFLIELSGQFSCQYISENPHTNPYTHHMVA